MASNGAAEIADRIAFPDARWRVEVGELQDNHYVKVICDRCGHKGRIEPDWFRRRFPAETMISDLAKRFKCSACGKVGQPFWDAWVDAGEAS